MKNVNFKFSCFLIANIFSFIFHLSAYSQNPEISKYLKDGFSILSAIEQMNFEILKLNDILEKLSLEKLDSMKRLSEIRNEMGEKEKEKEKIYSRFKQIAYLNLYLKNINPVFLFLKAQDYMEFNRGLRLSKILFKKHVDELLSLQESLMKIKVIEFKLTIEQAHNYILEKNFEETKNHLKKEIEEKKGLLESLNKDMRLFNKKESELNQAYQEFNNKLQQVSPLKSDSQTIFGALKGKLKAPLVNGIVMIPFGKKIHPVFKTITNHNGWTISPQNWMGDVKNIRAVAYGKIVFAGVIKGFGNAVLIDHAGSYHTLYAGLLRISVSEGDMVHESDIIGKIGTFPGETKGTSLYFEIRKDGKPVDPAMWVIK